ncbi:hypothetical protein ACQKTA_13480 (plasmid) [Enterococcus sp. 22-H-5-01]|uniref:hypothetical protein n=1 Tax=Enterococcus sp. 22-H-5-01 TaxID=3418555 RepID=UPI003D055FD6
MSTVVDLDKLIKDVACTTVDAMIIPPKKFNHESEALLYYQEHLSEILNNFEQTFEVDIKKTIHQHLSNT